MNECFEIYENLLLKKNIVIEDLNIICSNKYEGCIKVYDDDDLCCKAYKKADVDKYYIHTYNRDWVKELLKKNNNLKSDEIDEIFNLTEKNNCCNCISIVLYLKDQKYYKDEIKMIEDGNKIYNYLFSMKKSLDNVSNELKNFIVRFYIDKSVFEILYNLYEKKYFDDNGMILRNLIKEDYTKKYGDLDPYFFNHIYNHYSTIKDSYELLKYIIEHEQSEIYMFFCKNIIENNDFEKIRSFRFLPLLEKDTNILVSREADGFVSLSDCHNIKLFSNDDEHKILMTTIILENIYFEKRTNPYNSYHTWLNIYQKYKNYYNFINKSLDNNQVQYYLNNKHFNYEIDRENFICALRDKNLTNQSNIANILKCMNENDYKLDNQIITYIDILAGTFACKLQINKNYYLKKIKLIKNIFQFIKKHFITNNDDKLLKTGYDEILLREIFNPFTHYKYNRSLNNIEEINKLKNIFVFDVDVYFDGYENKYGYGYNIYNKTLLKYENILKNNPNKKKYFDSIEKLQKNITIYNELRFYYLTDYIFSSKFNFFKNANISYNFDLHLLINQKFEKIKNNEFYNTIYPEKIILEADTNDNLKKKYLKYKYKYLKLKKTVN